MAEPIKGSGPKVGESRDDWETRMRAELAIIAGETEWEFHLPVDLTRADPTGLRVGRFYERRRALMPSPGRAAGASRWRTRQDEKWFTDNPKSMAETVAGLLDGAHLVGAVPSFDAAFLTRWLNAHGQAATWHYHLVDVEALAAGWLVGTFTACQEVGNPEADGPTVDEAMQARPPWSSNDLSRAVGVDPEDFDRHTALGDARWAKGDLRGGARPVIDCTACGDTGVITVNAHTSRCTPLRCAGDCPQPQARQCERCANAALGEDLAG